MITAKAEDQLKVKTRPSHRYDCDYLLARTWACDTHTQLPNEVLNKTQFEFCNSNFHSINYELCSGAMKTSPSKG